MNDFDFIKWDSVGDSVLDSVRDSVFNSVKYPVWDSIGESVWAYIQFVKYPVWASVRGSVIRDYCDEWFWIYRVEYYSLFCWTSCFFFCLWLCWEVFGVLFVIVLGSLFGGLLEALFGIITMNDFDFIDWEHTRACTLHRVWMNEPTCSVYCISNSICYYVRDITNNDVSFGAINDVRDTLEFL